MFVLKLLRYLVGYVKFEARGVFFERFLNLCTQKGVKIFEPSKKDDLLHGYVLAKDYKKLKNPAKKSGLQVRIKRKFGLPFFISRYRHRLGIVAGIVVFLSVLTILSNFVWAIEVVGTETVDEQEVISQLEELGLKIGSYIPSIDIRKLEDRLMLKSDDIAWIGININSSVAQIQIHERVKSPEFTVDNDKACDVIASEGGLIKYMEVYDGQPQVAVGDTVFDGQLLVSGIIEDVKGHVTLKHARAKILALVWEDTEIVVDMVQKYKADTGEKKTLNTLVAFGVKIPLYFSDKADFNYYEESSIVPISVLGFELPIYVHRRVLVGYEEYSERLSEAAAKKKAFEELELYIEENHKGAHIEKQNANGKIENDKYILSVSFTIKKDIAKEKEILFEEKSE